MQGLKLTVLAVSVFAVSGCMSTRANRAAPWPWADERPCAAGCTTQEALAAYLEANEFCRKVQNYYESGGFYARSGKLAIGTVGAVAGSVLAPLASGSAAAAWSGVSGAANGLQTQMDEAFSNAVDIQRRASVVEAAEHGAGAYQKAKTDNDRVVAAIDMARSCAMSSAKSDQTTLRALIAPEDTGDSERDRTRTPDANAQPNPNAAADTDAQGQEGQDAS